MRNQSWQSKARCIFFVLLLSSACSVAVGQQRLALLIGVAQYQAFAGRTQGNLEGPTHDVSALRTTLIDKWKFEPASIIVLANREATHQAILAALDTLVNRARSGDEVFIYYSGHGVSARTRNAAALNLPYASGALTPYDWAGPNATPAQMVSTLIVGRRDIRPRLEKLDAAGVRVFMVADACYSGQAVRALNQPGFVDQRLPARLLPLPNSELIEDFVASDDPTVNLMVYPYKNVAYLSAASEGEVARDIPFRALTVYPTLDGKPHGAMTDALLRVLDGHIGADFDGDGRLSIREIARAVTDFMASRALSHAPQLLPSVADEQSSITLREPFGGDYSARLAKMPAVLPEKLRVYALLSDVIALNAVGLVADIDLVQAPARPYDVSLQRHAGRWYLLSSGGDAIANEANEADAITTLRKYAQGHRVRAVAESGRRGVLNFAANPSHYGGNFVIGQKMNFVVRLEKDAYVLVLAVDAKGRWSTLFNSIDETTLPLSHGGARYVLGDKPSQFITVAEPVGIDHVLAFAFDEKADFLRGMSRMLGARLDDRGMQLLLDRLATEDKKFTFNWLTLRTLAPVAVAR